MTDLYRRFSYHRGVLNDSEEVSLSRARDTDDSEEHILIIISQYEQTMHEWSGYIPYSRGLAIEQEKLHNIRGLNNNAKSARKKK